MQNFKNSYGAAPRGEVQLLHGFTQVEVGAEGMTIWVKKQF
jgi:hypothetical protein